VISTISRCDSRRGCFVLRHVLQRQPGIRHPPISFSVKLRAGSQHITSLSSQIGKHFGKGDTDYESDAMWKLYAASRIQRRSTRSRDTGEAWRPAAAGQLVNEIGAQDKRPVVRRSLTTSVRPLYVERHSASRSDGDSRGEACEA
jgi:hypothetical protein